MKYIIRISFVTMQTTEQVQPKVWLLKLISQIIIDDSIKIKSAPNSAMRIIMVLRRYIIRSFLHKGFVLVLYGDNRTIEMNIVMQAMNIKKVDMCM